MKDHEVASLKKSGLFLEPESNEDVYEAIRWYYAVMRYRRIDYESGMYLNMIPSEVRELYEIEQTRLHIEYLYYLVPSLDSEYIAHSNRIRLKNAKK